MTKTFDIFLIYSQCLWFGWNNDVYEEYLGDSVVCVILSKTFNLSGSQFSHLQIGMFKGFDGL